MLPENFAVAELWMYASNQVRVAFGGIVGMDFTALHIVADSLGMELDFHTLAKIHALETELVLSQNTKENKG